MVQRQGLLKSTALAASVLSFLSLFTSAQALAPPALLQLGQRVYIDGDGGMTKFATICDTQDALSKAFEGNVFQCHHVPVGTMATIVEISKCTEAYRGQDQDTFRYVRLAIGDRTGWTNKYSLMPAYSRGTKIIVFQVIFGNKEHIAPRDRNFTCEVLGMIVTDQANVNYRVRILNGAYPGQIGVTEALVGVVKT